MSSADKPLACRSRTLIAGADRKLVRVGIESRDQPLCALLSLAGGDNPYGQEITGALNLQQGAGCKAPSHELSFLGPGRAEDQSALGQKSSSQQTEGHDVRERRRLLVKCLALFGPP